MMQHEGARFPWPRIMEIGLGQLKLAPKDFWAMTLKELSAAAAVVIGPLAMPPRRGVLDELMKQYPDKEAADGTD